MKVKIGMFMYYMYGDEKCLAQVLNVFDETAQIVLRDVNKIKNTISDYSVYSYIFEVPFCQLAPIKGIV